MDQGDYHLLAAIGYTAGVIGLLCGVFIVKIVLSFRGMCDDAEDH